MPAPNTFYYTYGTEGYPFAGGWTEVTVPGGWPMAHAAFRAIHPDRTDGLLNCADFYDEEAFARTGMKAGGNHGAFCQERIRLDHRTAADGPLHDWEARKLGTDANDVLKRKSFGHPDDAVAWASAEGCDEVVDMATGDVVWERE